MCLAEESLVKKAANKNSVDGDNDIDVDDSNMEVPPNSQFADDENDLQDEQIYPCGHNNSSSSSNSIVRKCINRTRKRTETIETILPNVVWLEHILPCLDRPAWNSLMEASKSIYMLTMISKLQADYQRVKTSTSAPSRTVAQPPWPTNRSFQSKSAGTGQAIESIAISHDGEFLACGSVIGSIDIWNLRTGKVQWRRKTMASAEELAQCPNYFANASPSSSSSSSMQRRTAPLGSVLQFSPSGSYILACGFENRVFVWDLEKELGRIHSGHTRSNDRNHHEQSMTNDATPSIPLHKQHHISIPDSRRKEYENQERLRLMQLQKNNTESASSRFYQTLEIECTQGTIYEVTYLGFSNTFQTKSRIPNRLVARYGKTAYIWTSRIAADESSSSYTLTHKIPLSSSRCQMVSNPSLTCLAVATNGGSSRRNNGNNDGETSTPPPKSEGKGIIHVWDLHNGLQSSSQSNQSDSISEISSESSNKIVAYRNHSVRGLEFLQVDSHNNTISDSEECLLVSASLRGEVKFWRNYKAVQQHPRDRYNSSNERCANAHDIPIEAADEPSFVCLYQFQSPGKIFSLSSWSSIESNKILLAAGEARGQVRVWKLSLSSLWSAEASSTEASCELSLGSFKSQNNNTSTSKQERLEECLSTEVGDHVHYDNIKLLSFTPNGKSLAVSRAYDSKIWFQTVWQ